MKSIRFGTTMIALVMIAMLFVLSGCNSPQPTQDISTAVAEAIAATETAKPTETPVTPTDTPVPPTDTPIPPTATAIPPTGTPTPEPTNTPVLPTATSTPEPPTDTPVPKPEVKIIKQVNVRKGPGTADPIMGAAAAGQTFEVLGKNKGGKWWEIDYDGQSGWVFSELVQATNSESVQVSEQIPTPPPAPTPAPQPEPQSPQPQQLPADQGCYLIQNHMNVDLTFTFTAQEWQWNESFLIPAYGEHVKCLSPGRYTYTIDAPPPWGVINGDLIVNAGDQLLWPISGRHR